MQTIELRTFQPPRILTALLDSLVMSQNWVPAGAAQVTDRSEIPSALLRVANKAAKVAGIWRAWLSYDGIRLFTTEMSMDLAREHGAPALKVSYYDNEGRLQEYSTWVRRADGEWKRCVG
jgi:hypothetical protein